MSILAGQIIDINIDTAVSSYPLPNVVHGLQHSYVSYLYHLKSCCRLSILVLVLVMMCVCVL